MMNFQDLTRSGTAPQAPRSSQTQEKQAVRPRTRSGGGTSGNAYGALESLNSDLRNQTYLGNDDVDGNNDMSEALKFMERKRAQQQFAGGTENAGKRESVASVYYAPAAVPKKEKLQRPPIHLKPKTPSNGVRMADVSAIYGGGKSNLVEIQKKPSSSSQRYRSIGRTNSPTSEALASRQLEQQQLLQPNVHIEDIASNLILVPQIANSMNITDVAVSNVGASSSSSKADERIKPKSRVQMVGASTIAAQTSISNPVSLVIDLDPLNVAESGRVLVTEQLVESTERKLERPQSRKLYLGTGIPASGSPRVPAPKSAGAIKTGTKTSSEIKRMNSYNNVLGSASKVSELERRPPSRQSSAFPVHLAGNLDPKSRKSSGNRTVTSTCTAPTTPRGHNVERSSVHSEIDRPPSRQKIAAQDLWDGGSSRVGSLNELHDAVTGVVDGELRATHDPKSDGFTDIKYNNSPTFMVKFNSDDTDDDLIDVLAFDHTRDDVESEASDMSFEDSPNRPYTVQGGIDNKSWLAEGKDNSPDTFRSASAPKGKARVQGKISSQPQMQPQPAASHLVPVPPLLGNESRKSVVRAIQNDVRVTSGSSAADVRRSPTNVTQSPQAAASGGAYRSAQKCATNFSAASGSSSGGWMYSKTSFNDAGRRTAPDIKSKDQVSSVPPLLVRVSSSPVSVKSNLDIYEDDDASIETEESGELDTSQSTQSIALMSSLGEDFLSLFAPGI